MRQFQVSDRSLNVHQNYLLEASAGTGKTFSIQNIIVRLLIESCNGSPPLVLQDILVVTFTKAAARDLKSRIRKNIEDAIGFLEQSLWQGGLPDKSPDYLKVWMGKGEEAVEKTLRLLRQALYTFDQAHIYTIHSFCARMLRQFALESDASFQDYSGEDPLPKSELMDIVRNFFRTEVRLEEFSPAQLNLLLRMDEEQKKLLSAICTGYELEDYPSFKALYLQFAATMKRLKKQFGLASEKMVADFTAQAPFYKNATGLTKKDAEEKALRFSLLFDKSEWSVEDFEELIENGLVWVEALDPKLAKKNWKGVALSYPELTKALKTELEPIIEEAAHFPKLLLRMAGMCRKLLHQYQHEEERLSPDDILRKMNQALDRSSFLIKVQSLFRAAIVDEFQDTDPLQWQIFSRLFLSKALPWEGYLYLVGDPKQSIYSFRQADIYTYLAAAKALGEESCYSLDVNYRSRAILVEALNHLFLSCGQGPFYSPSEGI